MLGRDGCIILGGERRGGNDKMIKRLGDESVRGVDGKLILGGAEEKSRARGKGGRGGEGSLLQRLYYTFQLYPRGDLIVLNIYSGSEGEAKTPGKKVEFVCLMLSFRP